MKTVVKPGKLLLIILLPFALIESCKKADTLTKPIPEEGWH
jgi:hypothetical protein